MTLAPMRIAITHTRFSSNGGIEKYIYSLVLRLLDAGHEVHYLAARADSHEQSRLFVHKIPWLRFPPSLRVLSFDRNLNRVLARERFDLVHGFTKTSRQDIYTDGSGTLFEYIDAQLAESASWRRALHRASPHQRAILAMERARFQRGATRKIIAMAEFVREQILARYPVEPARIEVVYNGVETERFHPARREELGAPLRAQHRVPPSARVLAFAGNDWQRKGLTTAIESLATLRSMRPDLDLRLWVAGSDNHPQRYSQLAAELGVAGQITWLGSVRAIEAVFAAADLFVFPSRYDVFGNVGLEALASGVPAVFSARAGVSEILDPKRVGAHASAGLVLADPHDAAALARHTLELLEPARAPERAHAARALAEQYSWERHFARLLAIYAETLAEKRAEEARARCN